MPTLQIDDLISNDPNTLAPQRSATVQPQPQQQGDSIFDLGTPIDTAVRGLANGATLGLQPYISAAGQKLMGDPRSMAQIRDQYNADTTASNNQNPLTAAASNIVGSVGNPVNKLLGSSILSLAGQGAVSGAANSIHDPDASSDDITSAAGTGALIGGTLGGAIRGISTGLSAAAKSADKYAAKSISAALSDADSSISADPATLLDDIRSGKITSDQLDAAYQSAKSSALGQAVGGASQAVAGGIIGATGGALPGAIYAGMRGLGDVRSIAAPLALRYGYRPIAAAVEDAATGADAADAAIASRAAQEAKSDLQGTTSTIDKTGLDGEVIDPVRSTAAPSPPTSTAVVADRYFWDRTPRPQSQITTPSTPLLGDVPPPSNSVTVPARPAATPSPTYGSPQSVDRVAVPGSVIPMRQEYSVGPAIPMPEPASYTAARQAQAARLTPAELDAQTESDQAQAARTVSPRPPQPAITPEEQQAVLDARPRGGLSKKYYKLLQQLPTGAQMVSPRTLKIDDLID